jgi:hypothetical protein
MATPRPGYEEQVERNERLHRLAEGDARRDLYRTCLHMVFWVLCGLVLIGLAFHTADLGLGRIYYLAGKIVWIGGLSFTLLAYYRRQVHRGDR